MYYRLGGSGGREHGKHAVNVVCWISSKSLIIAVFRPLKTFPKTIYCKNFSVSPPKKLPNMSQAHSNHILHISSNSSKGIPKNKNDSKWYLGGLVGGLIKSCATYLHLTISRVIEGLGSCGRLVGIISASPGTSPTPWCLVTIWPFKGAMGLTLWTDSLT